MLKDIFEKYYYDQKLAVTGIITMLTAIWGMVSLEMAKDMKREIEGSSKDGERSNKETDKS